MELTLNAAEHEFLLSILEQHHQELQREIAHTDSREFRGGLRKDEVVLEGLIGRLKGAVAV